MSSSSIKITVIILFFHGDRWIDYCVKSLENQSLSRNLYEIILVDNGGSTPSLNNFDKKKSIKVIHLSENYGFTEGNNKALVHARGEIVLLLNQDVIVHFSCLKELLHAFEKYNDAGIISASMIMVSLKDYIEPNKTIPKAAGYFKLTRFGYTEYSLMETDKEIIPLEFVSGNGLSFRKTILKDIGNYLFDKRLGSYLEDLDLSIRLNKTDWKIYLQPKAVIYHFRDDAFSGKPSYMLTKFIHISTNRLFVFYNNLSLKDFLKKLPFLLLGIPLKMTHLDRKTKLSPLRFISAILILPIVLIDFFLKVLVNIRIIDLHK
jgi:GT2 family glycosyltransferase